MNKTPLFQLDDVRKSYDNSFELNIDHLEVQRGEVLCLLGPTGSGKSTLLRLLAGLDSTSAGTIQFDGHAVTTESMPIDVRRRMTMVHQRPLLLADTVQANIEYGLKLRGVHSDKSKTGTLVDSLQITSLQKRLAHTLSGGQTQLVALARALAINPDALLLDEPTSNLDPAHVAIVEKLVDKFRVERNATVVWTTHNLFQARRVADRVAFLLDGQLVEIAEAEQFFESPSDSRTADFLNGKMVY